MTWTTIKLADLAAVSSGGGAPQDAHAFSVEGVPFVRAGSLIKLLEGLPEDGLELLQPDVASAYKLKLFPAGTVLFAKSGMSATKGHIYQLKKPAYVVNHLAALTPRSEIAGNYLRHVLRFKSPTCLIKDEAYPSIRLGEIENMEVPAPLADDERQRIAAILDQADDLRRKQQRVLSRLNQLGQAIFHEMFGDPTTNPMGWPIALIDDLTESTQYGTSSKAGSSGDYAILRMGNISYAGEMNFADLKFIDFTAKDVEKYTVKSGDILFNRTNSPDLVGKTAVYYGNEPMGFAGYLVRLRLNSKSVPEYVVAYLNSPYGKAVLRGMCKAIIGMANINAKELRGINIPIPPVELQREFQKRVQAVRVGRNAPSARKQHLDSLLRSLQHRAFRGEL